MLSILVGAVAAFVFGALWFTVLFGRMWADLMGFSGQQMSEGQKMSMAKPMILNFIVNIIIASVIYYLFPVLLPLSFTEFLKVVLIVWLGFSFPIYVNQGLWERKSWKLVLLNSVNGILSFTILSAVIYYMQ